MNRACAECRRQPRDALLSGSGFEKAEAKALMMRWTPRVKDHPSEGQSAKFISH